jgi:hypothetical protein
MAHIDVMAGDGGTKLVVTIRDAATHAPVDLTGKTVQLRWSLNGAAAVTKTMTVRDQATNMGQAEYQILTTDLTAGGELRGEARLQPGLSGQLTTVDRFHWTIGTALP